MKTKSYKVRTANCRQKNCSRIALCNLPIILIVILWTDDKEGYVNILINDQEGFFKVAQTFQKHLNTLNQPTTSSLKLATMFLFSDLFSNDLDIGVSAWGGFYKIFGVFGKFETLNWFLTGVDFKVRPKSPKDGIIAIFLKISFFVQFLAK